MMKLVTESANNMSVSESTNKMSDIQYNVIQKMGGGGGQFILIVLTAV